MSVDALGMSGVAEQSHTVHVEIIDRHSSFLGTFPLRCRKQRHYMLSNCLALEMSASLLGVCATVSPTLCPSACHSTKL